MSSVYRASAIMDKIAAVTDDASAVGMYDWKSLTYKGLRDLTRRSVIDLGARQTNCCSKIITG